MEIEMVTIKASTEKPSFLEEEVWGTLGPACDFIHRIVQDCMTKNRRGKRSKRE